jgi:hypothetical protein
MATALGALRYPAYRGSGMSVTDGLGAYGHNVALAAALWPILHAIEVILRGRLDAVITRDPLWKRQGVKPGLTGHWFDVSPSILRTKDTERVRRTIEALAFDSVAVNRVSVFDRLPFGFWVRLLDGEYEQPDSKEQLKLWRTHHEEVFPGLAKPQRITSDIHTRFVYVRDLRNEVAHHGPLIFRPDLNRDYSYCLSALRWLSPDAADLIDKASAFGRILNAGRKPYVEMVEAYDAAAAAAAMAAVTGGTTSAAPTDDAATDIDADSIPRSTPQKQKLE